jgi:hypothetical protein
MEPPERRCGSSAQKEANRNNVPEPFLPGIGVTNTTLSGQILGHTFGSLRTFFKSK